MSALQHDNVAPLVKPRATIVNVTPEMAAKWLSGNTVNRKVRAEAINLYAADMLADRWTISESAICFSPDGLLLNGQHRLNAVIVADTVVPMLVMRNVPLEAMSNMDMGRKRNAADDLGFHGETHTAALASALKLAVLYTDGRIYKDRKVQGVSNAEMREFLAANADIRDSVTLVYNAYRTIDLTPTIKIVSHWLFTRAASRADADLFFDLLASRVGLPAGSPILALDSRLRELRKLRVRLNHRDELGLVVKAWNYWRTGKAARTLTAKSRADEARIPAVAR